MRLIPARPLCLAAGHGGTLSAHPREHEACLESRAGSRCASSLKTQQKSGDLAHSACIIVRQSAASRRQANFHLLSKLLRPYPSLPHGSADRNRPNGLAHVVSTSLPHGSADRNNSWLTTQKRSITVAPSRERGSKRIERVRSNRIRGVAPSRERGSKPGLHVDLAHHIVAPSRERGSKPGLLPMNPTRKVAPSRERGSKPKTGGPSSVWNKVAPSRERGSKLGRTGWSRALGCRSLTGARIETRGARGKSEVEIRRSLTGARIETCHRETGYWFGSRRSLTGARIETLYTGRSRIPRPVAPSRERGSKQLRQDEPVV